MIGTFIEPHHIVAVDSKPDGTVEVSMRDDIGRWHWLDFESWAAWTSFKKCIVELDRLGDHRGNQTVSP